MTCGLVHDITVTALRLLLPCLKINSVALHFLWCEDSADWLLPASKPPVLLQVWLDQYVVEAEACTAVVDWEVKEEYLKYLYDCDLCLRIVKYFLLILIRKMISSHYVAS